MITKFSHEDIKKWANFSGDYNKIHFEKEFALKNGLKDVAVHGMLVSMNVKSVLEAYIKQPSHLSLYFKQPVYINDHITTNITTKNDRISLKVIDSENNENILARILHTTDYLFNNTDDIYKSDYTNLLQLDFIKKQISAFKKNYPEISTNWILIDTVMFSLFFKYQKNSFFDEQAKKLLNCSDKSKIVTYHTEQKIFLSKEIIEDTSLNIHDVSIFCGFKDELQTDNLICSTFHYQLIKNDKIIYQTSLGCITKSI